MRKTENRGVGFCVCKHSSKAKRGRQLSYLIFEWRCYPIAINPDAQDFVNMYSVGADGLSPIGAHKSHYLCGKREESRFN